MPTAAQMMPANSFGALEHRKIAVSGHGFEGLSAVEKPSDQYLRPIQKGRNERASGASSNGTGSRESTQEGLAADAVGDHQSMRRSCEPQRDYVPQVLLEGCSADEDRVFVADTHSPPMGEQRYVVNSHKLRPASDRHWFTVA
ncbi:hypothetical protein ACVWXM_006247 [Bradyrhizobium sp. GM7.3]